MSGSVGRRPKGPAGGGGSGPHRPCLRETGRPASDRGLSPAARPDSCQPARRVRGGLGPGDPRAEAAVVRKARAAQRRQTQGWLGVAAQAGGRAGGY